MRPLAEPPSAIFSHHDCIAPLTSMLAIRRNGSGFADENHILAHSDTELLWAFCVRRDDRAVISRPSTMHGEIPARAGGRSCSWCRAFRSAPRKLSQFADRDPRLQTFEHVIEYFSLNFD